MAVSGNKRGAFIVLLLFASGGFLFADKLPVTLEAAEALEKEKKYDQAMVVYEEWLKVHPEDVRFPAVLRRCGELKKNPLAAIDLYRTHLERIKDPVLRRAFHRDIAQLYLVLRRHEAALQYFEKAYESLEGLREDDSWIATVPLLYVACGEYGKAYDWVARVNPVVRDRALRAELNYALLEIYLARGELEFARKAHELLAGEFRDSVALPKAVFRLFTYFLNQADRDKAVVYYEILKKDHPASLEFRAATSLWNGRETEAMSLLPDPHELVGAEEFNRDSVRKTPSPDLGAEETKAKIETPVAAVKPDKETAGNLRIQVGSYTMRENAVYMARDLEKLTFPAEIVEIAIKGKTYYRVFVGKGLSGEAAQTLLARLQDAGIGGYLFTGDK